MTQHAITQISPQTSTPASRWLTMPAPRPDAALRLFCFPYAGGGAVSFRPWVDRLPTQVELCAVTLPGRGVRLPEPAFWQLAPLVDAIAPALLPQFDRPFAFFGHSLGALLAFELTRYLRRHHQPLPCHLLLSGRRAPHLPATTPPLHPLSEADFLQALRRLNGTPTAVLENTELMQMLLPTLRADFAVVETYHHQADTPLACPMTTFGGLEDPETTPASLMAWQAHTTAPFGCHWFPGDHFFLHTAQPAMLNCLMAYLTQHYEP